MADFIESLNKRERKLLASYWLQRAEGEYTSWKAFQQVRCDLEQLGAHPVILALADRAVRDERKHATWCQDWSMRFGAETRALNARDEAPLRFEGAPDALQPLLRVAFFCTTATLGALDQSRGGRLGVRDRSRNDRTTNIGGSMIEVRHPFFHAMVVMSGTLVSCGGAATQDDGLGSGATGAEDTDGTGGIGSGGTESENGGTSSGGASSTGGAEQGTGGSTAGAGGFGHPELDCPPAQWTCAEGSAQFQGGDVGGDGPSGYLVPEGCECDESRPVSPDDCQLGERFTCWGMAYVDEKTAFDQVQALACECLKEPEECAFRCRELQPRLSGFADEYECETSAESVTLCGAAFVYLR